MLRKILVIGGLVAAAAVCHAEEVVQVGKKVRKDKDRYVKSASRKKYKAVSYKTLELAPKNYYGKTCSISATYYGQQEKLTRDWEALIEREDYIYLVAPGKRKWDRNVNFPIVLKRTKKNLLPYLLEVEDGREVEFLVKIKKTKRLNGKLAQIYGDSSRYYAYVEDIYFKSAASKGEGLSRKDREERGPREEEREPVEARPSSRGTYVELLPSRFKPADYVGRRISFSILFDSANQLGGDLMRVNRMGEQYALGNFWVMADAGDEVNSLVLTEVEEGMPLNCTGKVTKGPVIKGQQVYYVIASLEPGEYEDVPSPYLKLLRKKSDAGEAAEKKIAPERREEPRRLERREEPRKRGRIDDWKRRREERLGQRREEPPMRKPEEEKPNKDDVDNF